MILLLDPAHDPVRIGLSDDSGMVDQREIEDRREQSAKLLGTIASILSDHDLAVTDLMAIAVVRGPGPFTSLRVALASVNALAEASSVPMIGVTGDQVATLADVANLAAERLEAGETTVSLLPEYGRPPSITLPKSG